MPMRPAGATVTAIAAASAALGVLGLLGLLCAACVLCMWIPIPAAAAVGTPRSGSASATITRSAHVQFENCNAQHIALSVTVPRHAFTPAEPIPYTVRLRNTGSTACGTRSARQDPPFRQALIVGPCGSLPVTVRNANGVAVYPGPVYYNCPLLTSFRLAPHATATATGTWNQTELLPTAVTAQHAPPGTYRLAVDGAVTVPVTLAPA